MMRPSKYCVHEATRDWCSETSARALAEMIAKYWADRGYRITTVVGAEIPTTHKPFNVYGVRSNLIGGLPCQFCYGTTNAEA